MQNQCVAGQLQKVTKCIHHIRTPDEHIGALVLNTWSASVEFQPCHMLREVTEALSCIRMPYQCDRLLHALDLDHQLDRRRVGISEGMLIVLLWQIQHYFDVS